METGKKVVVVGGGIAGLAAGIYALKAGYQAEIYEKNAVPGGECMGWNRKGYHIDNCIHWLTGTKQGTKLWEVWKTVGAIDDRHQRRGGWLLLAWCRLVDGIALLGAARQQQHTYCQYPA